MEKIKKETALKEQLEVNQAAVQFLEDLHGLFQRVKILEENINQ